MNAFDLVTFTKRIVRRIVARNPLNARFQCRLCDSKLRRFLPYRSGLAGQPTLIQNLDVVGSDVENFECPACGCHDRERHLHMFLSASGLLSMMNASAILHIAPERKLRRFIRAARPAEYVLGDLHPAEAEIMPVDLQALKYPADHFDFVLANHVLEHVQDDVQALKEILRVLKPGGHAILQTPYSRVLTHKFEDPAIIDEGARLHAYGQEDHCRLYGRDIVDFIKSVGFQSSVASHAELLPNVDAKRFGVNSNEAFFHFQKSQNK